MSEPTDRHDGPPEVEQEAVARFSTPAGEAAIEVVAELRVVPPRGRQRFRLVNRGQVELMTGQPFHVERWETGTWTSVPSSSVEGFAPAFSDVGWSLGPDASTRTQVWPAGDIALKTGWYRIVKAARYEGPPFGPPGHELVARARFFVDDEAR